MFQIFVPPNRRSVKKWDKNLKEGKRIGCFVDDNPSEGNLYAIKTMGATKINNLTDLMRFVHEPVYQQMTLFL